MNNNILVVTPTYNCAKYLPALYDSLKRQTHKNWDWAIVDDGSHDGTLDLLKKWVNEDRIIMAGHDKNMGANAARNDAINIGVKYFGEPAAIYFSDADAVLNHDCLAELYGALDQNAADIAYCAFQRLYIKEQITQPFFSSIWDVRQLQKFNYISYMSLVRYKSLVPHLPLDETLPALQDWDLWLNIAEAGGKGVYVPKVLFSAFIRPEGISGQQRGNDEARKANILKIQEKHNLFIAGAE